MTFQKQILKNNETERGFTIVELLIVIIVIGILATLVLIAYNNVQGQARDSKRQADAASLREAAESFKVQSTTASYPTNTAAGFYSDMTSATLYPDKTVAVDQTVTNKINATKPTNSNRDYIYASYCGTTDKSTATGMAFYYYSESKTNPTPISGFDPKVFMTSTGSGC